MTCRVPDEQDHVCSRDFAPLVKLAWEPPGQQQQLSRPVLAVVAAAAATPTAASTVEASANEQVSTAVAGADFHWRSGSAVAAVEQQLGRAEAEQCAEYRPSRSPATSPLCWHSSCRSIHTGSRSSSPQPHDAISQAGPAEIQPRQLEPGDCAQELLARAEENRPAGPADCFSHLHAPLLPGRRVANEIDNRLTPLQTIASVAAQLSASICSTQSDIGDNHCNSRPVRQRKPPKTLISEMEGIQGAGASKRKRRAAKTELGEENKATTDPAQVVLEDCGVRNANGGASLAEDAQNCLAYDDSLDSTNPTSEVGKAGRQNLEIQEDQETPHFRGRVTRSRLCKTKNEKLPEKKPADPADAESDTSDEEVDSHGENGHILANGNEEGSSTPKRPTHALSQAVPKRRYKRKWRNQYGSSEDPPGETPVVKSSTPQPSPLDPPTDVDLGIGDFVWGKMRGFDWWPASIVSAARANQSAAAPGHVWVCWFGDNQFSQILLTRVRPLAEFRQYMLTRKPKTLYRKAILECAELAAQRVNKQFPLEWQSQGENSDASADETLFDSFCDTPRQRHLLSWALSGFLPEGLEGLRPSELDITNASAPPAALLSHTLPASPESMLSLPSLASPARGSPTPTPSRANAAAGSGKGYTSSVMVTPRPPQQLVQSDVRNSSGHQMERFNLVRQRKQRLAETCLCCGIAGGKVQREHPLFVGGICEHCIPTFVECAYCFDEDGSQTYCCICADGKEVYLCDSPGCARSYCPLCIAKLCGENIHQHIHKLHTWVCFMCEDQSSDLLQVHDDWHPRLLSLMSSEDCGLFQPEVPPPPPAMEDRQPIKVLGLFDGIGTGMLVLNELGIEVATYVGSEIDQDAIRVSRRHHINILHVGAVEEITSKHIQEWGPFDLVIGGSPCNDLSMANPARRGIFEGSGRLFFDFYRLLQLARPAASEKRPFFWLFENVVSMRAVDKSTISRFLECNPSVVDAKDVSPAHRPRYFWGNLPGMTRGIVPWPGDVLSLQECVEPNCDRRARFEKLRTITTKTNSIRQTKENIYPVSVLHHGTDGMVESEEGDTLWCTEMERIFGFPSHYTDVGNMGRVARQRLLGRAWSTPVIRHLLAPLRDYFKTSNSGKQLPPPQYSVGV